MRNRLVLALLLALLSVRPLLTWEASGWDGVEPALALSDTMDAWALDPPVGVGPTPLGIAPPGPRFEGEWALATWTMAASGHAQLGLRHPASGGVLAERAARAIDHALQARAWDFDTAEWGDPALAHLRPGAPRTGHDHAVLGYLGVPLGLLRLLAPDNRHAALHDRLVAHLAEHLAQGPILETYPGEAYPVDHAASLATVALHARATGAPLPGWWGAHLAAFERRFVDERGLLVQAVAPGSGAHRSVGRGSGTALATYFLAWADPPLARRLADALHRELAVTEAGVAAVREYAPATCAAGHPCQGDVDSGPLVLGASVSATGFALAAARLRGDDAWFARLWGTTRTFGAWDGRRFATGGPLGNAILFAMLTR